MNEVEELKKEIEWLKRLVDWLKDNMNYRNPYPWYPYDPINPNYSNPRITWKLVESDGTIPTERLEGYKNE